MRIGWATVDWSATFKNPDGTAGPGGSCWYRCCLPATYLRDLGHETFVGRPVLLGAQEGNPRFAVADVYDFDDPVTEETIHDDLDVVVFQRIMHLDVLADIVEYGPKTGQLVVNDVDDFFWGLDKRNVAHRLTNTQQRPEDNINIYLDILRASDLVTCSTPFLADFLLKEGCKVEVIRNGIDLERWTPKAASDRQPTIGWAGAVPWRSGDIETVRRPLRRMEGLGFRFHHSGHIETWTTFSSLAGLRASSVTTSPMVPTGQIPSLYYPFDVGIVPLNDIPFNHAKSFVKGLEMTAAGLPLVAQATPEYKALEAGGIGVTAETEKQWFKTLKYLGTNFGAREELRAQGQESIDQHSMKRRAEDWQAVLCNRR